MRDTWTDNIDHYPALGSRSCPEPESDTAKEGELLAIHGKKDYSRIY